MFHEQGNTYAPLETSLGQASTQLAHTFAESNLQQLDHETFTYPNFHKAYAAWSPGQRQQLAASLAQTRYTVARLFDPSTNLQAYSQLLDLWSDRPVIPPNELRDFAGTNVLEAITQADDQQLIHFLGWNQASLGPSAKALSLRSEEFSQSFMVEIEDLIANNQVPLETFGMLALTFQGDKQFCALDVFTSMQLECLGLSEKVRLAIAEHLIIEGGQGLYDVHSHETLHGAEHAIGVHLDRGLTTPLSGTNLWLREAFIEHVVQTAALAVEWDAPGDISDEEGSLYVAERKLMGTVSQVGGISMRHIADTFTASPASKLPELVQTGFRGLHPSGQPNLLAAISHEYNRMSTRRQRRQVMQRWNQVLRDA